MDDRLLDVPLRRSYLGRSESHFSSLEHSISPSEHERDEDDDSARSLPTSRPRPRIDEDLGERKLKSLYRGGRSLSLSAVPVSRLSEGNLPSSSRDAHFSMSSSGAAVVLLCRRLRLCRVGEGARDADEDGVIDAAGLDDRRRRRRRVPCCGRASAADDGNSPLTEGVMRSGGDDDVDEGGKNE